MSDCSPVILFGTDNDPCGPVPLDGCTSPVFEVTDTPLIIRAWNLTEDDTIYLEMVAGDNEGEFFERIPSGCNCFMGLTAKQSSIVVSASGRYRLNRCFCPDDAGNPVTEPVNQLAHVEYQPITTGAVVNYGDSQMACGCETVTFVPDGTGGGTLVIDNQPFVIVGDEVDVVDAGSTVVLTVNGESFNIDKGPDTGVEIASLLALRNCAGGQIGVGDSVVLCSELNAAVATLNATIAALPDVRLQALQSYDAATNTLTLLMSDDSTVPVNMTLLLNDAIQETIDEATITLTDAFGLDLANAFPA